MSDAKPNADALAKQLKDKLVKRRLQPWKLVLAALAASVVVLLLLAWWMYPRPKPRPLLVMAFDVICTVDEVPQVRAQLHAQADDDEPRRLKGLKIVFLEPLLPPPPNGKKPRETQIESDEHGQGALEWPLHEPTLTEYSVLHIDPELGTASVRDGGRIFVWPRDAPLLLVDADETLIAKDVDAEALATLQKAAKEGWRIVYLAPASTDAHAFRKARRWLHEKQAKLPLGPVLGRGRYPSDEPLDAVRADGYKRLTAKFTGKALAIVKSAEAAQIAKDAGLRTVMIGEGPAPAEVLHVLKWGDIPIKR